MSKNLFWQNSPVSFSNRTSRLNQKPVCIWFTGLSGSGKSTIAHLLENKLYNDGFVVYCLDGDNLRHGLNRDLGFSDGDRKENIRRVAEVAKLMVDAGIIILVSLISPFKDERQFARSLFNPNDFYEIYVDTSIFECQRRDPKGLYQKAKEGEIKNFTGFDSEYEPPLTPEVHLETEKYQANTSVEKILDRLRSDGVIRDLSL